MRSTSTNSARIPLARARAAARARGRDDLSPYEREAAHRLRREIGAAIRAARHRRELAVAVPLVLPPPARRRPWRLIAVTVLAAAAIALIALFPTALAPSGRSAPAAEPSPNPIATIPPLSRGISLQPLEVTAQSPAPLPTVAPSASVAPASGVPGGSGQGGSGGGTGTGNAPPPLTQTWFVGQVIDARTGRGIPGVCVGTGNVVCGPGSTVTNPSGTFALQRPANATWNINFSKDGYVTSARDYPANAETVPLGRIPLQPQ